MYTLVWCVIGHKACFTSFDWGGGGGGGGGGGLLVITSELTQIQK